MFTVLPTCVHPLICFEEHQTTVILNPWVVCLLSNSNHRLSFPNTIALESHFYLIVEEKQLFFILQELFRMLPSITTDRRGSIHTLYCCNTTSLSSTIKSSNVYEPVSAKATGSIIIRTTI